jgi:hypothetical protein
VDIENHQLLRVANLRLRIHITQQTDYESLENQKGGACKMLSDTQTANGKQ